MDKMREKKEKAEKLRKEKKFAEAIPIYKELWEEANPKNKWDGWGYAICLNQTKQYQEAYKVSRAVYESDKSFSYIRGQFAWTSYMLNINYPDTEPTEKLEGFVKEIIEVTGDKEDELFRVKAILKMMDHLQGKGNYNRVIEWSKKLNPDILETKSFNGTNADGKKFRTPSDKESYYLKLSKALEKSDKYNECILICDEGLKLFPEEIWFKWHKGVALRKLHNYDGAIELLKEVNRLKRDWFVLKELSASYYDKKEYENALKYFIEGCIGSVRITLTPRILGIIFLGGRFSNS